MRISSFLKFHLLLTGLFFVVLFVPACGRSQVENEPNIAQPAVSQITIRTTDVPTPTITPTFTQILTDIPTSTPTPTATITPTANPTDILPQLLEKDTSDLFAIPVLSFLFPSGWDIHLVNPPEGHYQEMQPILLFVSPEENSWLTFEITAISDLGNDSSQALDTYSNLRIDHLQNSFPETEVINQQDSLSFTAEGVSQSHQLEWIDQGNNLEGFALMGLDPTGSYGYMFEGVQHIGDQNLRNLVMLPWTSFFPLAVTSDSLYTPFNEKFDDHGFIFRYPFDSQASNSDTEETSDQESNSSNGRLIIQPPWDDVSAPTYLSWITQKSGPNEKTLDLLIFEDLGKDYGQVEIIGQGSLNLGNEYAEVISHGRFIQIEIEDGQAMVGAWQCPNDDRVFILHLENNLSEAGIETLYLFQRYLIGFSCQ